MLKTIPQYLSAMSDTYGLTKTLGVIDIYTTHDGAPWFAIGNSSVIFRIKHEGRDKMLKCYTRNKRNLRRIYGDKCLREELYIHDSRGGGEWVDVILDDWIEGTTLSRAIAENLERPDYIRNLAEQFDKMALRLLDAEWAHGDLKPDNIIVTPEGRMQMIDFDALFRPEFEGEPSDEIGTAAFQHPSRGNDYFDKSIDDYPIALISTALHALSVDPTLAECYDMEEVMLFHPRELVDGSSESLSEVLDIFATEGMVIPYRIARLLHSPTPRLFGLRELIGYAVTPSETVALEGDEPLSLDEQNGLWGYRRGELFVIPPLYDNGFEFSEGLAAVCFGGRWHYIDSTGHIRLNCSNFDAVKSFHNSRAVVIENGVHKHIDINGKVIC